MSTFRYKVLIADGDAEFQTFLKKQLQIAGYDVLTSQYLKDTIEIIYSHTPDIILLDLTLSDGDGSGVLTTVRKWSNTPIIIISKRSGERDVVNAFNIGCDDYVFKPVRLNELLARISCAIRRTESIGGSQDIILNQRVTIGDMTVDFARHNVYISGVNTQLTPNEFRIIAKLSKHIGEVVTYRQIIHELWGPTANMDTKILRVHMANVRKKFMQFDKEHEYIKTVTRTGYILGDIE